MEKEKICQWCDTKIRKSGMFTKCSKCRYLKPWERKKVQDKEIELRMQLVEFVKNLHGR